MKSQLSSHKSRTSRRTLPGRKLIAIKKNTGASEHDLGVESEQSENLFDSDGHSLRQSHAVLPGIARSQTSLNSTTPDATPHFAPMVGRVSTPLPVPIAQQRSCSSTLPLWYAGDLTADVEPHRVGVTVFLDNVNAKLSADEFAKFCIHCYKKHSAEVDVVLESPRNGHFQTCLQRSVATICLLWIEDDSSIKQAVTRLRQAMSEDDGTATYVALVSEHCTPTALALLTSAAAAAGSVQPAAVVRFKPFTVTQSDGHSVAGLAEHLIDHVDSCFSVLHQTAPRDGPWTPWLESAYNSVRWCHHVATAAAAAGDRLHVAEREIVGRKLQAALRDTHDVVAVTGPPGCGKTWLVGRVAADFARDCRTESRQCVTVARFCALGSSVGTYGRLLHDVLGQLQDALPGGSGGGSLQPAADAAAASSVPAPLGGAGDQMFSAFRQAVVAAAEAHPTACILLVLDGLDYLRDSARTSTFLEALSQLPPGIAVLVSIKEPTALPTGATPAEAADAWHASLSERGALVTLSEGFANAEAAAAFAERHLPAAAAAAAAPALAAMTKMPLFLASLAAEVMAAGQADPGTIVQSLAGKSLVEALHSLQASASNADANNVLLFCSALELSCFETATHVVKALDLEAQGALWRASVEAASYRLRKAALLFDVVVGGCRSYIWQHSAYGQNWALAAAEPVEWLKVHAGQLREVLLNLFTAENAYSAQLGPTKPAFLEPRSATESDSLASAAAAAVAAAACGGQTAPLRPRLLHILPKLISKYCASVFDFSKVVLFFDESEPSYKEMEDLAFATYCGYAFITAKLRYAGVRALLHDLEDFLAVWAFKFESARTNVERTGLTAFEQLYAFFVTNEKLLAHDTDAFDGALTGSVGIDISMEHDRMAVTYERAQGELAARRALRLSTASLRMDSSKFDAPRSVSNPVKNMMLRRERQYYASTLVDNQGVHLSHGNHDEVKVWRSDGTLMFEKSFEGCVVVCCTAVAGRKSVFAVTTAQKNTEREMTLAVHCVGDCYWYRAGDLGPRDTIAAWMSPDAVTLITCEKVSSDTLRVKLCRPAPVVLSQQPRSEVHAKMDASHAQMTFISRYLELPQLVEDTLYDEMVEHSEREGGSERAELKYYSSLTADETHYNLDIAGLDADADGMHAMRYLWTEMRQFIDQDHFSLPIDELCSANLKLSDVITKKEVAVLGWFSDSGIVVIRAAAADGSSTTLYVMRSMSDERLEIQKELTLDARPVLDLSPDGLLVYADSSTQLTLWNLAANEKDVLDSSSCHGPESVTCVKYVASTSHLLYAFSTSAASIWDVKSRTLVKAVPWQMASPVTSVAIADNWLVVGLDNGNVSLYAAWKHLSSIALQGTISSICVGKVEGESIKFSCIHKGQPSASIAFLTWSPETTWSP